MALVGTSSPAASRQHRPGSTAMGIVLLCVWALISLVNAGDELASALQTQLWLSPVALGGTLLLIRGVRASTSGRRFDEADQALADALDASLRELCTSGPEDAFRTRPPMAELADVGLVQVERHFDQQVTYGATMISPMGDALFAVVEAPGPAGPRDTYRVISLSPAAGAGWVIDLVTNASHRFGGPTSHAGATLLRWAEPLAAHFAPADVAYASDRLVALASRPAGDCEPVTVRGAWVAPHTLLAAHVCIGASAPLLVTPLLFPVLLDHAVGHALEQAPARLPESERPRLALH